MTADELDKKIDSEMTDRIAELEKGLVIAFVQGAKWWEWHETDATMWQSDQRLAEAEALKRVQNKTLGKLLPIQEG